MFSLFRKKHHSSGDADLSGLKADMHSHMIPGIDDGAPDLDASMEMIRGMMELGYRKLITTPHIQWDMFQNTPEKIRRGEAAVKQKLQELGVAVEFSAAAEYFMDDHFQELLTNDEPLLTLKDNLVLVEFSFIRQPVDLKETLFKLQIKNYQAVIAHPERYLYFGAQKHWYDDMKESGCLFQLNLLSLCGYYGKKQEELAQYLIKKKYVDLLGSDLHNQRHAQVLKSSSTINGIVQRLLDAGALLNPQL